MELIIIRFLIENAIVDFSKWKWSVNKMGNDISISATYFSFSFSFSRVLDFKVSGVVDVEHRERAAGECSRSLLVDSLVLGTSKTTGSSGSDETDFTTSGCITSNSRRETNMLMVTTTVRMFHRLKREKEHTLEIS